jgi:hypothetical protein
MSVSSSRAVSIITGTGRCACTRRQTSRPSKPGSMMSRISRSGCQASAVSTAAGPSPAVCTRNPSARKRAAMASTIVGSSSTTSTRRCAPGVAAEPFCEVCVCSIARP